MELAAQYLRLIGVGGWLHKGTGDLSNERVLMYAEAEGAAPNYYWGEKDIIEKALEGWALLGEIVLPMWERGKMVSKVFKCSHAMVLNPEGLLFRKDYPPEPTES